MLFIQVLKQFFVQKNNEFLANNLGSANEKIEKVVEKCIQKKNY